MKKQTQSIKPTEAQETKEEAFHRIMDRHYKNLKARYNMIRRTMNSHRVSASDAELLCLAISGQSEKCVAFIKARIADEEDGPTSIWQ